MSVSLQYPPVQDGITNILLIDNSVRDYQVFVNSANIQTLPIVYSPACSKTELLAVLSSHFTAISRVAFIFEGQQIMFLNHSPFFVSDEKNPYSANCQFVIDLIKQFNVQNVDFLACNTLQNPLWQAYYEVLAKDTNVVVGASSDTTGNLQHGGDWTMETTGQDIENLYFTSNIEYYKYLLGSGTSFSVSNLSNAVYVCGYNDYGQIGLGEDLSANTLTQASVFGTPIQIVVNSKNSYILMSNGNIYYTGLNTQKTFILLSNTTGFLPVKLSSVDQSLLVLMNNGTLYGLGINSSGQLGVGDNQNKTSLTPVILPNGLTVKNMSAGYEHSLCIMSNGSLYGCGSNSNGQAGLDQSISSTNTLTLVTNTTDLIPISVECVEYHSIVLMDDGSVYGFGGNFGALIGRQYGTNTFNLTELTLPVGTVVSKVATCLPFTLFLLDDGSVYGTGLTFWSGMTGGYGNGQAYGNNTGSLMLSTNTWGSKTPVNISTALCNSYILMSDGSVWGTGGNRAGQLGLGDNIDRLVFNEIPTIAASIIANEPQFNIEPPERVPCFHENSKILTNKGYKMVKDLRKGDLIQTYLHGFIPIDCIGYSTIYNSNNAERISKRLYRCSPDAYPELFDNLIITGCHSILVTAFKEGEREKTRELLGDVFVTDKKKRLPAAVDERAIPYEKEGNYTIWHFALENTDYYMNYGIYANGLLVETCSKRYMKEESNMIFIE